MVGIWNTHVVNGAIYADHDRILSILHNMAFVMERNPKVFHSAGENLIRDHFLVQLNGQYDGGATGETFNANGRTDIVVKDGSMHLFIAECKIWHGEKEFLEAIDQLFEYLTWRDCKAAIIVFSRNRDTTAVIETIKTAIAKHPQHKRGPFDRGETNCDLCLAAPMMPTGRSRSPSWFSQFQDRKVTNDDRHLPMAAKRNAAGTIGDAFPHSRLDVFRMLVEAGPDGMSAGEIAQALDLARPR